MSRRLPVLPIVSLLLGFVAVNVHAAEEGFTSLFDGKTLSGWEGKEDVFRVEEGAITAGSLKENIKNNEFLCTKKDYGDFELRLEAKLVGPGENAGIQFRSERIPNHHEVIGYQCDMGLAAGKSIWGALYDESRRRKFLATGDDVVLQKKVNADGWNHVVIRCQGPRIQLWVNEVPTVDYSETEPNIATTGKIALQIHGGKPAQASYRNIRIKELGK
ncbi:hypothetical protein ETAA8_50320 [Anatilimnocola aggregata]|uniref:3-keto-alpha-glucoside-1,2-lyase/3-keto-2-hydroxy-glucal hydratase domain-containing protein n=1 Tax=Anatilimnocola aggregata TaxID=2528021 RepID=A0A517YI79_9BACT|nr:DUF1080 domain-containing protein [Anatilimnocola aggregata]QDU29915.1 hypothetical protein ETAA8_50320 [Anatilimnocola aggregata]